jgi:hypothetical protein
VAGRFPAAGSSGERRLKLGWYNGAEIDAFEAAGELHAGFEARAVRDLLAASR